MRMSCNGCRVLRKGCSENCSIRPCLQWIKSPESQANATVFLAKFYGRAGLINLLKAGPEHLRPAIFRSLLYEACGRIVNPIFGSVGLLWSGTWSLCHNAVEAVLNGAPITPMSSDSAECNDGPPLKAYGIRHVSKEEDNNNNSSGSKELHRVRTRCRFKKSSGGAKPSRKFDVDSGHDDSSLSHQSEAIGAGEVASITRRDEPGWGRAEDEAVELELTLGLEAASRSHPGVKGKTMELGFD